MNRALLSICICAAFILGVASARFYPARAAAATPVIANPTQGFTLHIDAQKHFGDAHPTEIAHHWCKAVSHGLTECQIYDSDKPNARLVEVETIVGPDAWKSFNPSERALWHYHKVEIARVKMTLPGLTPAQAKKVVASIIDTYGKVWMLWDPMTNGGMPVGTPTVVVLK